MIFLPSHLQSVTTPSEPLSLLYIDFTFETVCSELHRLPDQAVIPSRKLQENGTFTILNIVITILSAKFKCFFTGKK